MTLQNHRMCCLHSSRDERREIWCILERRLLELADPVDERRSSTPPAPFFDCGGAKQRLARPVMVRSIFPAWPSAPGRAGSTGSWQRAGSGERSTLTAERDFGCVACGRGEPEG